MKKTFVKDWNLKLVKERVDKFSGSWLLFAIFLGIMILDRFITLINFGFIYTDIDQTVLWNGAIDYSKGIFHEPFFYGQAYSYMLESFLAVPLLWMHFPVYIALPISTSIISLLPFVILALFFRKKENYFWAYLCLVLPVLLPLQYNFLTTISRGFVQAHFFVPLLFIPFIYPQRKKSVTVLYFASAICVIANQSSILIVLPILFLVYTYHFKSLSFYIKSLIVVPFFIVDYFAKYFYEIHPERVLHRLDGIKLDGQTLLSSIKNANHFENLFPFFSSWGIVYPFLFIFLAIYALSKSMKKEFIFILSIFILLLITLAIPKVQTPYLNAGLFFTPSRLYLYLPILLILASYLVFRKLLHKTLLVYLLLVLCGITFITKNLRIQETIEETIEETVFPVAKNQDLIKRANKLKSIAAKYKIDLIVHANSAGWNYVFDSYVFNPLTRDENKETKKIISVNLYGDRRTWLYPNSIHCKQILLNGIKIDETILDTFDHEIIGQSLIVIKYNKSNIYELFAKLNLQYGYTPL